MRRTPRRLLLVVVAAVAALGLAGCVNITQFTGSQPNPVGGVQIVTQLCRGGTSGCADDGNGNFNPDPGVDVTAQVLIGYRVSAGSAAPGSLRFFDDDGQGPEFLPSPSYTAELQRLAPAPAGQQWFGYVGTPFTYPASLPARSIFTKFGLPAPADGSPVSDYAFLVVAGYRGVEAGDDTGRPIACGASLFQLSGETVCIDSPAPGDVTSWRTLANLRDVGIAGGTSAPVPAGGTASVPFTLRTNGTQPGLTVTLATSTAAPSGSATVAPGPVALAPNSSAAAAVTVTVADGTPPGDYPVTLTATNGSDVHAGQGIVRVRGTAATGGGGSGGAAGPPSISARVAPKSIGRTRRATPAVVTATLSEAGTVTMVATRAATGRRRGRACVAPTPKLVSGGARRCTRFVPVATITRANLGAGARTIPFSGRGRAAGSYRLTLTLRAGGRVSRPAVVRVTVRPS